MRRTLTRHPVSPCDAVERIAVEAVRVGPTALSLAYVATGRTADLAIPPIAPPERTDELWKHTCFEAFIAAGDPAHGYIELNLSPSTRWAAYRFTGHREGMANAPIAAPGVEVHASQTELRLAATLDLAGLLPEGAAWRLALTAVIEERAGPTSYWSLAHPEGRPDFHSAAGFVLMLPAQ
jgi:hypothetical protein